MYKVFFFLGLLLPTLVAGDELHLIFNGKAYHFDRAKNYNEDNWGVGFEYDLGKSDSWIPLITGSRFKDSNNQNSNYLGGGIKRRFELDNSSLGMHVDVGIIGFLMTRHDYNDNDPFLGALPFVSVGNEYIAINTTYIPSISPKHTSLVYFQLMIKLTEF